MLSTTPTITTSMVTVSVLQQPVPITVVATPRTTTTSTVQAQVAQRHALTMVVEQLPNYGGGYTTNYYDSYGASTGSSTTRSNYGGGTTTNYYDQYGRSIGSSTTRENYGGGTSTTYYDAYGNNIGSSSGW